MTQDGLVLGKRVSLKHQQCLFLHQQRKNSAIFLTQMCSSSSSLSVRTGLTSTLPVRQAAPRVTISRKVTDCMILLSLLPALALRILGISHPDHQGFSRLGFPGSLRFVSVRNVHLNVQEGTFPTVH